MTARPQIQNAHARTHTLPLNIFVVVVSIDFPTFVRLRDRPRAHALAYTFLNSLSLARTLRFTMRQNGYTVYSSDYDCCYAVVWLRATR